MIVAIKRQILTDESSISRLTLDGCFQCWTLEPTMREIEGEPVEKWKIKGRTAIPCGTFDLAFSWSPKFNREMPLLLGVPGFTDIRIHMGNTDVDTEGCILVGARAGEDVVFDSRNAFSLLFLALRSAAGREPVSVTVAVAPDAKDSRSIPKGVENRLAQGGEPGGAAFVKP